MDCTFQQDEEVELLLAENQALAHKLEELNLQRICSLAKYKQKMYACHKIESLNGKLRETLA